MNVYTCGGSLIHPSRFNKSHLDRTLNTIWFIDKGVVLTAAHCLKENESHILKIRAGEWNAKSTKEFIPHQDRQVRNYSIIHAEFYGRSLYNDVAFLFLAEPIEITGNVNTVCSPQEGDIVDGSRYFATEWGKDKCGNEGQYQNI